MESLKAQLREMDEQRQAMELEIEERSARLTAPGMPGLKGPLVDDEGYPFAHVDVFQVRTDRNRLAILHTDHKALSSKIEKAIHELHAIAREAKDAQGSSEEPAKKVGRLSDEPIKQSQKPQQQEQPQEQPQGTSGGGDGSTGAAAPRPFALIDEVSAGSPAMEAGMEVGDRLCRFGGISRTDGRELQRLGQNIAGFEGQALSAAVLRGERLLELSLTPKRWDGRGLLGCHLTPIT